MNGEVLGQANYDLVGLLNLSGIRETVQHVVQLWPFERGKCQRARAVPVRQ